mmetsp:Transcript_19154/g.47682  ORF Transcript_19154/g.47682 Transcript_19154/m.47682 type:complete len:236 (+) Transcript_19154:1074-1781(+)
MEIPNAVWRSCVSASLAQNSSGMIGVVKNVHDQRIGSHSGGNQEGFLREILQLGNPARVVCPLHFAQNGSPTQIILVLVGWGQIPYRNGSIRSPHCQGCNFVLECRSVGSKAHAGNSHGLFASILGLVLQGKEQLVVSNVDEMDNSLGISSGNRVDGGRGFQAGDFRFGTLGIVVEALEGVNDFPGSHIEQNQGIPRRVGTGSTKHNLVDVRGWMDGHAWTKGGKLGQFDPLVHF